MSIVRWVTRRDRRSVSPSHAHVEAKRAFGDLADGGCHRIVAYRDYKGHWTFEAERFERDKGV